MRAILICLLLTGCTTVLIPVTGPRSSVIESKAVYDTLYDLGILDVDVYADSAYKRVSKEWVKSFRPKLPKLFHRESFDCDNVSEEFRVQANRLSTVSAFEPAIFRIHYEQSNRAVSHIANVVFVDDGSVMYVDHYFGFFIQDLKQFLKDKIFVWIKVDR